MQNFRGTFVNKHRDAWVEVNLGHLEHNLCEIKKTIFKNCEKKPDLLAVIKADGYGHGSVMCAPIFSACGVKMFGVASVDEALELRENKITAPILVLGAVPIWAYETAIKNDITVSIFTQEHLEAAKLIYERIGIKLKAHIKIDSGMNRIGISPKVANDFIKEAKEAKYLDLTGIFTHFADVENKEILENQIKNFKTVINSIDTKGLTIHCSNSLASLACEDLKFDMVRLGIILYGLSPMDYNCEPIIQLPNLKQIIGLKGRITNIHRIKAGEGVSYGHKFKADKDTTVATIPIGYADGVSRSLSEKIEASLNGKKIKQIGRITMDQMMFDITGVEASLGDVITLLGEDDFGNFFSIDDWAKKLNTINYELTCRLKVRLPRIYVR